MCDGKVGVKIGRKKVTRDSSSSTGSPEIFEALLKLGLFFKAILGQELC